MLLDLSTKPVFYKILHFSQFDPPAITMVSPRSKQNNCYKNLPNIDDLTQFRNVLITLNLVQFETHLHSQWCFLAQNQEIATNAMSFETKLYDDMTHDTDVTSSKIYQKSTI